MTEKTENRMFATELRHLSIRAEGGAILTIAEANSIRKAADLIDQLTAPISGDVGEIEKRHDGDVWELCRKCQVGSQEHRDRDQLLALLRSAESAKSESVRAAYEDATKIADECERVGAPARVAAAKIRERITHPVDEGYGCVFCDMKITPVTAPDGKLFHEGRGGVCNIPCTNRARAQTKE